MDKGFVQRRHELATGAVGILGALGFAGMAESVKEALIPTRGHTADLSTTLLMAGVYFFTGLNFFVGTQYYLWRAERDSRTYYWIIDFVCTSLTLSVLVFLGYTSQPSAIRLFAPGMIALYLIQIIWLLTHRILIKDTIKPGWWLLDTVSLLVAVFAFYYTVDLSSKPWCRFTGLLVLLVWEIVAFFNISRWAVGRKEDVVPAVQLLDFLRGRRIENIGTRGETLVLSLDEGLTCEVQERRTYVVVRDSSNSVLCNVGFKA